jgi:hypothetical protein
MGAAALGDRHGQLHICMTVIVFMILMGFARRSILKPVFDDFDQLATCSAAYNV